MNRYKLMRYERGLHLFAVCEGAGIPESTLRRLESGDTIRPSAPYAKALADYYGITVAELLGLTADEDREAA